MSQHKHLQLLSKLETVALADMSVWRSSNCTFGAFTFLPESGTHVSGRDPLPCKPHQCNGKQPQMQIDAAADTVALCSEA